LTGSWTAVGDWQVMHALQRVAVRTKGTVRHQAMLPDPSGEIDDQTEHHLPRIITIATGAAVAIVAPFALDAALRFS
jgi:hypothetical protein